MTSKCHLSSFIIRSYDQNVAVNIETISIDFSGVDEPYTGDLTTYISKGKDSSS